MGKTTDADGDEAMNDDTTENNDIVKRLFGIELESTLKNTETDAEPAKVTHEEVLKLSCHIDNNNKPIDSLSDGLEISLSGQMEKNSEVLGRNALFDKTSRVNKLPSYLCV
jgi:ubiquitin carboxyl-terminal hydrolase 14